MLLPLHHHLAEKSLKRWWRTNRKLWMEWSRVVIRGVSTMIAHSGPVLTCVKPCCWWDQSTLLWGPYTILYAIVRWDSDCCYVWTVGCLNNDSTLMSRPYAWRPLGLFPILKPCCWWLNDEINQLCSEDKHFRFSDGKIRLGWCFWHWHLLSMDGLEIAVTTRCGTDDCPVCEVPKDELDKTDVSYPLRSVSAVRAQVAAAQAALLASSNPAALAGSAHIHMIIAHPISYIYSILYHISYIVYHIWYHICQDSLYNLQCWQVKDNKREIKHKLLSTQSISTRQRPESASNSSQRGTSSVPYRPVLGVCSAFVLALGGVQTWDLAVLLHKSYAHCHIAIYTDRGVAMCISGVWICDFEQVVCQLGPIKGIDLKYCWISYVMNENRQIAYLNVL